MMATASIELLVIGAGPAGLAAATLATQCGVKTCLLDEQTAPGGQIYRAITTTPVTDRKILGKDYWKGEALVAQFKASGAQYQPGATVWQISALENGDGYEVAFSVAGVAKLLHTRHVLLATGAQERPFPIPGWTLPGVVTAGAAQILLKQSGLAAGESCVLAGSGPLLYLLAWQYLNAGVKIDALLDTTPKGRTRGALRHAWAFLRSPYFSKGVSLLRSVRAAVPIVKHVAKLEAVGKNGVLADVRYEVDGVAATLPVSHLLLHQGVVPNINMAQAAGVQHHWNDALACWEPRVDDWGSTNLPHFGIAGDGAGIAGALAAAERGRLAGLQAAFELGHLDQAQRDHLSAEPRAALARANRGREFIDALYLAAPSLRQPVGDTIVCRCEEVTAAQVRDVVKLGVSGPNQMKAFLRCGMGPCQGRLCGLTVTELIACERGVSPIEVGYYRLRFPTKPISLGELASLPQTDASRKAVVRFKK